MCLLRLGVNGRPTYSKVVHVTEEDVDLDNLVDVRASSHENGLEVADASSGLLLDSALDQVALGVKMDLARAVDCRWGLDGLGLEEAGGVSGTTLILSSR